MIASFEGEAMLQTLVIRILNAGKMLLDPGFSTRLLLPEQAPFGLCMILWEGPQTNEDADVTCHEPS